MQAIKLNDYKVLELMIHSKEVNLTKENTMKELFNNPKEDEYLSEFRQKIAQEMQDDMEQRKRELERSRNGFIGTIAGIVLAAVVSWFLLLPKFGYKSESEIPIIRRPITPVKIQPSDPGGMAIQNQDKTVYALVEKNDVVDTKVESLLPPPEMPKMPTIVVEEEQIEAEPVAKEEQVVASMDDLITAVETTATEKIKIPEKLPVIDVNVQKLTDAKVSKDASQMSQIQPQKVVENPKEAVAQLETQSLYASKGRYKVQMMASSKREGLEKGYKTLIGKYAFLKNLPYYIEDGKDGLLRLKIGAFDNKKDADELCGKVRNAGGSCMVKE